MAKYLRVTELSMELATTRAFASSGGVSFAAISDLFEIECLPIASIDVSKLIIEFDMNRDTPFTLDEMLDVIAVYCSIDCSSVAQMSPHEQKEYFVQATENVFREYSSKYGWDMGVVLAATKRMRECGLQFDRPWGKPVWHRSRKMAAQLRMTFETRVSLYVDITDKTSSSEKRLFIVELPASVYFAAQAIGKLKWLSETELQLMHKNNRDYWLINLETESVEFHFIRAESGDAHGQYALGCMYQDGDLVPQDRDLAIHWLRKAAEQGYKQAIQRLAKLEPT